MVANSSFNARGHANGKSTTFRLLNIFDGPNHMTRNFKMTPARRIHPESRSWASTKLSSYMTFKSREVLAHVHPFVCAKSLRSLLTDVSVTLPSPSLPLLFSDTAPIPPGVTPKTHILRHRLQCHQSAKSKIMKGRSLLMKPWNRKSANRLSSSP